MTLRKHKPNIFALLAVVAFFGGYAHQLLGQFSHHHHGIDPHHAHCQHHDKDHDRDHSDGEDGPRGLPQEGDDLPSNEASDECLCALTPATIESATPVVPAFTCVETAVITAVSVPGTLARAIDHPPAA